MVQILIADDHEVIRSGVRQLIERHPGWEVCAEAETGTDAVDLAAALKPEVIIIDLNMPGIGGIEAMRRIRERLPEAELLVFTMHDGDDVIPELVDAGASGYLSKTAQTSQIVLAIGALASHKPYFASVVSQALCETYLKAVPAASGTRGTASLSAREREIMQLVCEGGSNKEVAAKLQISAKTVETHRAAIMRKLKMRSVVDLVHYAIRSQVVAA